MLNLIRRVGRHVSSRSIPYYFFSTKVVTPPRVEPLVSSSLESTRIVKFDESKETTTPKTLNVNMDVLSLREMLPYLSTHRNSTMVIHVPVKLTLSKQFRKFVHDLVLLHTLGIRLVLVADCEDRVREYLTKENITYTVQDDARIVTKDSILYDMIAAQEVRSTIEQQLSRTFMSKGQVRGTAKMKVSSGNFVMAQPKGLQNGEDFEFTGIVRSVDKEVIMDNLRRGDIVLLSHMAHSHQGLTYSCDSIALAETCAVRLGAEKLIFLHEGEQLQNSETGERIDLPLRSAVDLVSHMKMNTSENGTDALRQYMRSAVNACRSGVRRTHLVNRHVDGALLVELFSRDGHGLLISRDVYEGVRRAVPQDVNSIKELIEPLERRDILIHRDKSYIKDHSQEFYVVERDGHLIACAQCIVYDEDRMAEIACVAVNPKFQFGGQANALLSYIKRELLSLKVNKAFVLTTKTYDWFVERGFADTGVTALPEARLKTYDKSRRPKVLMQELISPRQLTEEELFLDKLSGDR